MSNIDFDINSKSEIIVDIDKKTEISAEINSVEINSIINKTEIEATLGSTTKIEANFLAGGKGLSAYEI
jgi:hypothetical protein